MDAEDPATVILGTMCGRARSLLLLAGLLFAALPAWGEIVVFTEGSFAKVHSFELDGDRILLEMTPGGFVVMPLLRIERILDDEVPTPKPPPPPLEPEKKAFTWRYDAGEAVAPEVPFGELINQTAQRHDLNPRLVAAVMGAESAAKPTAVSHKGARGLMQLMPATAARFGLAPHQVFEPAANLDAGSRYLAWLGTHFGGDLRLMLAGYNAGEGTVKRYGGIPPYRETIEYIRRIFGMLGLPTS